MRVKDTISLPPNSESFVACTLETRHPHHPLVLVNQSTKLFRNGLIVAPALINGEEPTVLIYNPTNAPITLYAGQRVSTACEAIQEASTFSLAETPVTCATEVAKPDPSYVVNLDSSDVTEAEKQQLQVLVDEFRDVFSTHQYDIGSCTAGKVHIFTTSEPPARIRPHRIPIKYREELQKHINTLSRVGVMKESNTNWVRNLVLVRKKDNFLQICLDMQRPLNAVT